MNLSVCLIARNEQANIARAIRSVQHVADEVVLADTGSTDDTVEIAKKLGARVELFPWCDDFAAARNHALDRARGEWILWLDADEELLDRSVAVLRRCIADHNALAWYVQRQDLADPDDLSRFTVMWQMRLFRNRPDLRFVGRCHPHFAPHEAQVAAAADKTALGSEVMLRHFGYFAELRPAKLERSARLLAMELADRPGQFYYQIELAGTYRLLEDERASAAYEQAAAMILPRVDDDRPPTPQVALLLEYLMQVPDERQPAGWSVGLARQLARRWFEDSPPLIWIEADRALAERRFADAQKMFARLVRMGERHDYDKTIGFDPRIIGDDARLNLAVALTRQGELEKAQAQLKRLLHSPRRGEQAKQNLATLAELKRQHAPRRTTSSRKPRNRRR